MRNFGDTMGAQRIDNRKRSQHIPGNQRHLGQIDNLTDRLRLSRVVHKNGLLPALDGMPATCDPISPAPITSTRNQS